MRATWPTARKSESEPGASAGARLRNRSGRQSDEPVVALFFVDAAPLMPHVLPPPGACPCRCPGSCPGSCRARARHIPAGRAVRLPCGAWERPSSAEEGMRGGPSARRNMRAAEYFPRFLPLLPPFFSRILSLPGSFRHRPPCGAWERPSSTGRGCGVVRPPVGMCGRRSVSLRFLPPPSPSFSRCRSGPRDFSGKRCGGEK